MPPLHRVQIEPILRRVLQEDWGFRDWTTDICVPPNKQAKAQIIAKQATTASGLDVAQAIFELVDSTLHIKCHADNGQKVAKGTVLMEIEGLATSILKAERVSLNYLGRLCGIAELARQYVCELEGTKTQLLDTRKTTPGMRLFEKAAVMAGGARNHRFGLCDGVMLKENHIRAVGGIKAALSKLLDALPPTLKIEVETTCLTEVEQALEAGADIIMLDNMALETMTEAVQLVGGRALVEASGNVRQENLKAIAATGVDFISTSAVITQAKWADLSLLFEQSN